MLVNTGPEVRAGEALLVRKEEIARATTETLYAAHPEMLEKYGERGRAKCLQDMRYTLEYLRTSVVLEDPSVFERYVTWLVSLLRARDIPPTDVRASLDAMLVVIAARLAREESDVVGVSLRAGLAAAQD